MTIDVEERSAHKRLMLKYIVAPLALLLAAGCTPQIIPASPEPAERSEEHTSELQSLMRISYAVFCLKKKTPQQQMQRLQHHLQKNITTKNNQRNKPNPQ